MSKRIGIRHAQSPGGKALVCPEGEQIVNGGFETGDFTGWNYGDTNYAVVSSEYPRSGSYACELRGSGWIKQDLANPVPEKCFTGTSKFGFYAGNDIIYYGSLTFFFRATIIYTDETTTIVDFEWYTTPDQQTAYQYVDLKPYVTPGKIIKSIKIERLASNEDVWIDDVTCYV